MKEPLKLSIWGIASLVAYVLVIAFGFSTRTLILNQTIMTSSIIGVNILSIIPIFEFGLKAYLKQFKNLDYQVSILSIIITVFSFGIPVMMYGYVSFLFRDLLWNEHKSLDKVAFWGLIVLSVLSLGVVWLFYGVYKFVLLKVYKDILGFQERLTTLDRTMLVMISIFTIGLIWIVIFIDIAVLEFLTKIALNKTIHTYYPISTSSNVIVWVSSILTAGIIPFIMFLGYGLFELVIIWYHTLIHNYETKPDQV